VRRNPCSGASVVRVDVGGAALTAGGFAVLLRVALWQQLLKLGRDIHYASDGIPACMQIPNQRCGNSGRAPDVPLQQGCPAAPAQYRFLGGNDRLICLRRRATAAAFLRLRSVVGFS